MPLRVAVILISLFAACVAIVALAWAFGTDLYFFLPGRRCLASRPPTPPIVLLLLMALAVGLFLLYSQHYGLVVFSVFFGGVALGSLVGYFVFAWTPTLMQWMLTIATGAETIYGWTVHEDYLEY
jgi:hypothetical protein